MSFDLANPNRAIEVGVILMKGETEVLDVAPIDLFNGMNKPFIQDLPFPDAVKAQALDVSFHWVNENGDSAKLTCGITVQCTDSFATCPPLDVVLMGAHKIGYVPNEAELAFIRKAYDQCSAFLTICGGFDAPLRAGLFEGKTVTAPRFLLDMLRKESPGVKWVEKRWARDGKLWTSGALLNGTDLMKAFAEHTWASKPELVHPLLAIGGWPIRDVDYKDVDGKL